MRLTPVASLCRLRAATSALSALPWMGVWLCALALCTLPVARAADAPAAKAADHAAAPAAKAADHGAAPAAAKAPATAASTAAAPASAEGVVDLKKAIRANMLDKKNLTLLITDKPEPKPAQAKANEHAAAPAAHGAPAPAKAKPKPVAHAPAPNPKASRDEIKAKAAAMAGHGGADAGGHGGEVHWSYEGEGGPQHWGKLKPEFNVCAIGKRQAPINIEVSATLQGPAEPLQFNYNPSGGSVVNNGHTIQVDLQGDNSLTVRGTTYRLLQFHFHTPSEEQINYRPAAMVAHLVHKSADDQLAVVAVLLDPGQPNPVINTVWTYMPLDANDRVRLPLESIDLNELLPKDQRYYQFIGSLTTPPCTENVLWNVLKQPVALSKEQIRLFQQLYPANARPVQAVNGRPIRSAQ